MNDLSNIIAFSISNFKNTNLAFLALVAFPSELDDKLEAESFPQIQEYKKLYTGILYFIKNPSVNIWSSEVVFAYFFSLCFVIDPHWTHQTHFVLKTAACTACMYRAALHAYLRCFRTCIDKEKTYHTWYTQTFYAFYTQRIFSHTPTSHFSHSPCEKKPV